jgi:serine/threonine protein kinase
MLPRRMTSVSQDGPLRVGEQFLGKYEIRSLIGRGGFARVYHAINHFMGAHVAIKVLWREGGVDKDVLRRGQAEAQILNQLRHENVVQIIDAGIEGGHLYLVMELLDGRSLREILLEHRRLTIDEVLELSAQVADGVQAAHAIDVIHRDLKPENIYVRARNRVKVLDFGIAKLSGGASWTTQKGMAHGTAFYMSPEQMQVLPLGPANDMYSLGIIMYEALIGHQPIRALLDASPNVWAVAHVVIHKELPMLDAVDPRIPHGVAALVKRAIDKDPKARFGSMKEFADAIRECRAAWLAFAKEHGVPRLDRDLSQPATETGRLRAAAATVLPGAANADQHDTVPISRPLFLGAVSSGTLEQRAPGVESPFEPAQTDEFEAAPDENADEDDLRTNPLNPLPSSGAPNHAHAAAATSDLNDSRKEHYGPRLAPPKSEPKAAPAPIQINSNPQPSVNESHITQRPSTPAPKRANQVTPAPVETPVPFGPAAIPGVRAIGALEVLGLSVVVGLGLAAAILYLRRATPARASSENAVDVASVAPTAEKPPTATHTATTIAHQDDVPVTAPTPSDALPASARTSEERAPGVSTEQAPLQRPGSLTPPATADALLGAAQGVSAQTQPRLTARKPTSKSSSKGKPTDDVDARMRQLQQDLAAEEASHTSTAKGASKPRASTPNRDFFPPLE